MDWSRQISIYLKMTKKKKIESVRVMTNDVKCNEEQIHWLQLG